MSPEKGKDRRRASEEEGVRVVCACTLVCEGARSGGSIRPKERGCILDGAAGSQPQEVRVGGVGGVGRLGCDRQWDPACLLRFIQKCSGEGSSPVWAEKSGPVAIRAFQGIEQLSPGGGQLGSKYGVTPSSPPPPSE